MCCAGLPGIEPGTNRVRLSATELQPFATARAGFDTGAAGFGIPLEFIGLDDNLARSRYPRLPRNLCPFPTPGQRPCLPRAVDGDYAGLIGSALRSGPVSHLSFGARATLPPP